MKAPGGPQISLTCREEAFHQPSFHQQQGCVCWDPCLNRREAFPGDGESCAPAKPRSCRRVQLPVSRRAGRHLEWRVSFTSQGRVSLVHCEERGSSIGTPNFAFLPQVDNRCKIVPFLTVLLHPPKRSISKYLNGCHPTSQRCPLFPHDGSFLTSFHRLCRSAGLQCLPTGCLAMHRALHLPPRFLTVLRVDVPALGLVR